MKILITWSKWHAEIGESLTQAFKDLGHEAEIFYDNPEHWSLLTSKIIWRSPWQKYFVRFLKQYQGFVSDQLFKKVKEWQPDFIFVIRGIYFNPEIIEKIQNDFKIPVANWIIDDPGISNIYEPSLLYSLKNYSHFFIVDESWGWYLKFFNNALIYYLPHAGNEKIFRPLTIKKDLDIFWVGSLSPNYPNTASAMLRASILNQLIINGFKITAVAPGLNEMIKFYPALRGVDLIAGYRLDDKINEFYNRAKIVLNINAPQLKTDFSDRLFTIALSKSFQLVDFKEKLSSLFDKAGDIIFRDLKELVSKVKFYLNNKAERERIADLMYNQATQKHIYKNRAEEIIKKVFK